MRKVTTEQEVIIMPFIEGSGKGSGRVVVDRLAKTAQVLVQGKMTQGDLTLLGQALGQAKEEMK